MTATPSLLLISVGNTRTRYAFAAGGQLDPSRCLHNADLPRLLDELASEAADLRPTDADGSGPGGRVVMASVNDAVADQIERRLNPPAGAGVGEGAGAVSVLRAGRDLPIPIDHTLPEPVTAGQDRLLNALGAFQRSKQACVIIDAGTAVTVDFVDGQGIFHGGAIAPGLHLMLRSLHEHTAALPLVELSKDLLPREGEPPFGKTTSQAMTLGAVSAVRGLAHRLIDSYAEFYQAYPRVIATGGDAALLFDSDSLVEHIVPDLTLIGLLAACEIAVQAGEDSES